MHVCDQVPITNFTLPHRELLYTSAGVVSGTVQGVATATIECVTTVPRVLLQDPGLVLKVFTVSVVPTHLLLPENLGEPWRGNLDAWTS